MILVSGAGGSKSPSEVGEHLARLHRQVTGTDEVASFVLGLLAGDEHQPGAGRDHDMGVPEGSRQVLGVDVLEGQGCAGSRYRAT